MYDQLTYNTFIRFYTLFKISIPFALLGIIKGLIDLIKSIKHKQFNPITLFWLFAFAEFILGLIMIEQPNSNKLNGIFYSILVLIVYGFYWINDIIIAKFKSRNILIGLYVITVSLYLIHFIIFANYYYFEYKYDIYPQTLFTHTYSDELEYLDSINTKELTVYTESNIHSNYQGDIFYRLSAKVSPYDYNRFVMDNMYKNVVIGLPNTIEKNAYYIVLKINSAFLELIKYESFNRIEFENYYVFEPILN